RYRRRKQAELAEGVNHECLEVYQPETDEEHQQHEWREQDGGDAITESSKGRETENTEVRSGADERERHARHDCVLTAQNFRAARNDRAANTLSGYVFNREVDSVSETCQ